MPFFNPDNTLIDLSDCVKAIFLYMRINSLLFFLLGSFNLIAQKIDYQNYNLREGVFVRSDDFDETYLDSLEFYYQAATVDSIRFSLLHDLAYYWHTRNLKKSDSLTALAYKLVPEGTHWMGEMGTIRAAILLRDEKLDSAELILNEVKLFTNKKILPFWYTQLQYVYERRGELDRAVEYALEALRVGEELDDPKSIAQAYSDLANLYYKQNKINQALNYGLRSISMFEERGLKDLDFSFTLYVVGIIYSAQGNIENALQFFNRSNSISEQYGFYNNLSDSYISLTELYLKLNDLEKALISADNSIKYATLLDNNFLLMRSWLAMGQYENLSGNYQAAILSLEKSLEVGTEIFGDDFVLVQIQNELSKSYAGLGRFQEAFEARLKFDAYKDSLYQSEADRRIAQMQTAFEVKQKEETITLQEKQLKQSRIIQLLTGGLLMLALAVSFILLRGSKKNKKLNFQLNNLNESLKQSIVDLDKSNGEKELLLKEIHHRVKNNLAVVTGLLELQSAHFENPQLYSAIQDSKKRVSSMSIIHQKLYQRDNLTAIEMKDYFQSLGEGLLDAFGEGNRVNILYPMEKIYLDVDNAVPIGLITNELVTNAFKHAFPNGRAGNIEISLTVLYDDYYSLIVKDDGVGYQNNGQKGSGFGSQLINLLAIQIGAKIEYKNEPNQTSIELKWKRSKKQIRK